ncbi:hypothetical protein JB92DRAFT_1235977 [Gautieria morchelliformis]|nr:hypothetical protein JB92DRAFT_1235977 [Gautieria morchelliformis]
MSAEALGGWHTHISALAWHRGDKVAVVLWAEVGQEGRCACGCCLARKVVREGGMSCCCACHVTCTFRHPCYALLCLISFCCLRRWLQS